MTRQELAEAVNLYQWEKYRVEDRLDRHDIGAYERGLNRWPREHRRDALRAILDAATDIDLGFFKNRRPRTSAQPQPPELRTPAPDVVRVAGAAWFAMLPAELAELPGAWTTGQDVPRRVGAAHLAALRASIVTFEQWDHEYGGGLARAAMAGQLEWVCRAARHSTMTDEVRRSWLSTAARLADLSCWAGFDAGADSGPVHRKFLLALQLAGEAGDVAQRVHTATSLSRHLTYFGHIKEALEVAAIARLGWTQLPPLGRAVIGIVEARAHGRAGAVDLCRRAVDECDEQFTVAGPGDAEDPTWGYYADRGQILGDAGHALFDLAVRADDDTVAAITIERLQAAYATHPVTLARSRALTMLRIAHLQVRRGDVDDAVTSARAGISDATQVDSRRVRDDLEALRRALAKAPSHATAADQLRSVRQALADALDDPDHRTDQGQ